MRLIAIIFFLIVEPLHANQITDTYTRYQVKTHKSFDNAMSDLRISISEHNFRITNINRIGEAITKMHDKPFVHANVVSFCSISFAQEFIKKSWDYLLYMPCRVVLYQLNNQVIIESYLFSANDKLHQKINLIIKEIVDKTAR